MVDGTSVFSWTSIVGTLLALLLVLALAWGALWLLKRTQFGQMSGRNGEGPQVLRSLSLGPRERLVVVRHHQVEMLLGVTAASIVVLHERPIGADGARQPGAEPRL